MKAHVIEGGKVVNTIEVESLDFMPNLIDASLGGKIGDAWDGMAFSEEPAAPVVPQSVPRRKAVKYMRRTEFSPGVSLYDHLIATINSIPDLQMRSDAMDDFLESLYFERDSPQMIGLAALAGISREQLDFHLTEADKLP
jgi:hypothetical protein